MRMWKPWSVAAAIAAMVCVPTTPTQAAAAAEAGESEKTLYVLGHQEGRRISAMEMTPEQRAAFERGLFDGATRGRRALTSPAAAPGAKDEKVREAFKIGAMRGQGLEFLQMSKAELDAFKRGFRDGASKAASAFDPKEYGQKKFDELAMARVTARIAQEKAKGEAYLAKAAREKGAARYDSGLVFKELKAGTGRAPAPGEYVTVNFRGTLIDGTPIDDTYAKKQPAGFRLHDSVIPCWTEGLQKMKRGGKARFVCPSSMAFGDMGRQPEVPGGATVIYEFELVDFDPKRAE